MVCQVESPSPLDESNPPAWHGVPNRASKLPPLLAGPVDPNVGLLLESRIPARMAWVSGPGEPRVVPIWFHWTGRELLLATFAGARKLRDLKDGSVVAVTIDSEAFPYRSLKLRGRIRVEPADGLADCYRLAAERYLGPQMGQRWLEFLAGADQVVLRLSPTWAVAADMAIDSPFYSGGHRSEEESWSHEAKAGPSSSAPCVNSR